ncbi:MAG: histidine kinase N-terminal 7TM domain-containing protein [Anaerovoracaceae bacterium]|jgi:signal transduction histidine kinase
MEVSEKLAIEFNTIILSHLITLMLLLIFTSYIYFRAKKSPLLFSYLSVVGMIAVWMVSKIFKTLSPVIELRWLFILTQYFAINSLSICFLVFAYTHSKNRLPSKKQILMWSVLPMASFLAILTNPLHMSFYSYFDIYKDRFGILFYIAQSVHYIYLAIGIYLLAHGFTKQSFFAGKKSLGNVFAIFVLLPLSANAYYVLFKMDLFPWIFPFSVFDFSPIAASISLILFMFPALKFRYFDISPVSLSQLYNLVPQGLIFLDNDYRFYGGNKTFYSMQSLNEELATLKEFVADEEKSDTQITLTDGSYIKITKTRTKDGHLLLILYDVTEINKNHTLLLKQNYELEKVNRLLDQMAKNTRELAITRTKAKIAQNVHDILGHSLTVVIGTAEIAAEETAEQARKKAVQIEELLTGSLNDLRNTFSGKEMQWGQTTLTKAIGFLKNESINVDINIHGNTYELNSMQTEAIYRLCQEAITNSIRHGKSKSIHLILRYHPQNVEIYAIDNGMGCKNIKKSYGLTGIEDRFTSLCGSVSFTSDGESGFTIHGSLPRVVNITQSPD